MKQSEIELVMRQNDDSYKLGHKHGMVKGIVLGVCLASFLTLAYIVLESYLI